MICYENLSVISSFLHMSHAIEWLQMFAAQFSRRVSQIFFQGHYRGLNRSPCCSKVFVSTHSDHDLCSQLVFLKSNVMCWLHTLSHVFLAFLRHTFCWPHTFFDWCRSPTWKCEALDPRLLCELMRHFESSEVRRYFWASKLLILGSCIVLWTAQLECWKPNMIFCMILYVCISLVLLVVVHCGWCGRPTTHSGILD